MSTVVSVGTRRSLPRAKLPRVGFIGDSILQGNNLASANSSLITALATRAITWTRAAYPYFDIDTWIDNSDSIRHFSGLNAGFSGETTAQILARANRPLLYSPEVMIVSAGINSVVTGVSAVSIESDLWAICDIYLKNGIKVILSNIRPVGASIIPDDSPQLLVLKDVNIWIRDFATMTKDVAFWDAAAAYDDGHGRPMAKYTADGLHPVLFGSQHAALGLTSIMRRLIEPIIQPMTADVDNFFPNGRLRGEDGTAGSGVTGRVAHGFEAQMLPTRVQR